MDPLHESVIPSLSERRGRTELQYIGSRHSSRPSTSTYQSSRLSTSTQSFQPSSSISSFASNKSFPTNSNTSDVMSVPPTPTEAQWYAMDSARLDEDFECCDPLCADGLEDYQALGLGVDDVIRRTAAIELSEKLHASGGLNGSGSQSEGQPDSCRPQHHDFRFAMPPTPPSHMGERVYCATSPTIHSQEDWGEFDLDPEAFGSLNRVINPQSPTQRTTPKGRRTTLLNKMFPQKLRDNLMRRMSGATSSPMSPRSQAMPNLPPLQIPPYTPPTEDTDFFWPLNTATSATSNPPNPDYEFELPIPEAPHIRQVIYSPLQSPRAKSSLTGADVFPELVRQPLPNEVVQSPLQPPTITPLLSPCAPTASQTSLNMLPPIRPEEYTVPSIDPQSPRLGRKLSQPIETMSVDTITQMILGMQKDEEAYTYMIERMKGHGWSTPQEIQNLELQREESKQKWQLKINGAKRVLAGLHKCGYPAYQFPDRSTRSMDSVRSDYTTYMRPCIDAGPEAKLHRTYSR